MIDDSNFVNIKKTWQVTWGVSKRNFDDYSEALSFFNDLLERRKTVILYEIIFDSEGSKIKKIPVLNSKIKNLETGSTKKKSSKIKIKFDLKYRIIILISVFLSFLFLLYLLSILSGTSKTGTIHPHFILSFFLQTSFPNFLQGLISFF